MIGRRELFGATAATLVLAKSLQADAAPTAANADTAAAAAAKPIRGAMQPRGVDGRLVRLGTLDLESQQDFTLGFRLMHSKTLRTASNAAFERVLAREGIDPLTPLTIEQVRALVATEPAINIASRAWLANQQVTWKTLRDHFHAHADEYLSEMEAADKTGPGTLDIPTNFDVPAYTRHEIHIQPGGYVGDPFAGHIYHYGTNSFYISVIGHNEQDQVHKSTAGRLPLPEDGKVKRILDMGCGIGQMTVALKERFPDAEVWGIDVGAPMVRYAHLRANKLGVGANFAQRLAEDTKFPDNYFDIVTSYIMHHELPAEITRKVIAEAQRVTRPGGVYYPIDFMSGGNKSPARMMYGRWYDHRWNNEVWSLEYHNINFTEEIGQRGFTVVKNAKPALPGFGVRHTIKT
ncbi:MAG: class I SAM-dependent methyltransferase [Gammaproteobacteria bacterium]|jgi:SAM-dependent methyltransferase|nr:class I SAM-dependent methyltransferase [Gammaproteobacteria bacterium]